MLYITTLITTNLRTPVCHATQNIMYHVFRCYKLRLRGLLHIVLLVNLMKILVPHNSVYRSYKK